MSPLPGERGKTAHYPGQKCTDMPSVYGKRLRSKDLPFAH